MQNFIDLNNFLLIATLLTNLSLGLFILFKDQKNVVNQAFGSMLLAIAYWAFSFLMFASVRDPGAMLFWRRMLPVGSALAAGYLLYFSLVFPKRERPLPVWQKTFVLLPGYCFTVLSVLTPWLIRKFEGRESLPSFLGTTDFGQLYRLYACYLLVFFTAALFILTRKFVRAAGREKVQIFYVLVGTGLAIISGALVSLLMPLFGVDRFFALGPYFSLVMVGFIVYAIVRHRLLNIENFMLRSLIIAALAVEIGVVLFSFRQGNLDYFITFSLALVQIVLGLYLLFNNPKNEINLYFAGVCCSLAFWTVSVLMLRQAGQIADIVFWGKFIFFGPILTVYLFLCFSFVFPERTVAKMAFRQAILFVPTGILLVLLAGPWILQAAEITTLGPSPIYGLAYPVFAFYLLFYFSWGIFNLIRKHRWVKGVEKIQIRYLFLGLFLTFILSIITNMIMPVMGEARFINYGPISTLFFLFFTAYAIARHRLMSIEVIIQRSTVYAFATILIMAFYALAVLVSEIYLRKVIGYTSLIISALAAMIIAVAYQPLVKGFQVFTDRIFFRGRYDYQKTLNRISQEIAAVIKLEELVKLIAFSFVDTMKVTEISFLLLEKEGEHFRSIPLNIARYKRIEIDVQSPIVAWLNKNRDILVREEVEDAPELEVVQGAMDRLGISVWVPIVSKDVMIGIIALGNKLSGDVFSAEDLALLNTLASQTAVALDNARLYDEVLTMKNYSEEILQSMNNGVLTTDLRGKIITINYMAERITGRKRSEVIGRGCAELWGKKSMIALAAENTIKDVFCLNLETTVASPEKGLVPISLSSTVLRDSQGKKTGILLTIQDLTEIKELEDKVRRGDKLSALATMAAGMAHEIKNPLSSMKVFAQLLPKKFADPEYRKKLEEILPREINRIDRIVESLLGFARATAMTFEKAPLNELIEETVKYYEDQAKNNGVKIVRSYSDLPEIEVDKGQIAQVFSNLILNAIQAMPEGGELTIKTLPDKKDDDLLRTIKIQISDTGHGISEEMQKKLFDPFFTTKYGGTGLGLTITHSIVDGHKGSIDLASKIGQGTAFTITLPVRQGLV